MKISNNTIIPPQNYSYKKNKTIENKSEKNFEIDNNISTEKQSKEGLLTFNLETGESILVNKSEEYTEDNPIFIVKGTDKDGNTYENKINANKINPKNASFVEMSVLHTDLSLKGNILGDIAGNFTIGNIFPAGKLSIFEKMDFMTPLKWYMDSQFNNGNIDEYIILNNQYKAFSKYCYK